MSDKWSLNLRSAIRQHPEMRGSVGQVVDKHFLKELIRSNPEIAAVLHYDETAKELTIEDPQFMFYIRNVPWHNFAKDIGFSEIGFKTRYDFALSFAGADRRIARMIFEALTERQIEVFFDENEQHRIMAENIEEYLRPIYQSEARFVVPLLGREYPNRIWTAIESDAFKNRLDDGGVIPIVFKDVPLGMFDNSRKLGGYVFDPSGDVHAQVAEMAELLSRKLVEVREAE